MNVFESLIGPIGMAPASAEAKRLNFAYTRADVERLTGKECRENLETNERASFLTCQIGDMVTENRRVGHSTLNLPVFHLQAYGRTWQEALHMLAERQRKGKKE